MTPLEEVGELLRTAETESQWRTVASRAYYVSFRRLVAVATTFGFNQDAPDPAGSPRRSVHRRLFDFLRGSSIPVLRRIGRSLVEDLYDLRIRADYRLRTTVTKGEAEEAMRLAQDVEDWIEDAGLKPAF